MDSADVKKFLIEKTDILLNEGIQFGPGGL